MSWLLAMSKIGYGVRRLEIPLIVKDLLDKAEAEGYEIPESRKFQNNKSSKNWVTRFLSRHPEASQERQKIVNFREPTSLNGR